MRNQGNPSGSYQAIRTLKEHVRTRYRFSATGQKNVKMTSHLSKRIRTGENEEGEIEEDSNKIFSQFYKEQKRLLYYTGDGVGVCKKRDDEKILHKHNLIIIPQLYHTEVVLRSLEQMRHQGIDNVQ